MTPAFPTFSAKRIGLAETAMFAKKTQWNAWRPLTTALRSLRLKTLLERHNVPDLQHGGCLKNNLPASKIILILRRYLFKLQPVF
jgi:hypothetical protein